MKCPKCGYLGFEHVDRCRNCGYDFSLSSSSPIPDLPIRSNDAENLPPLADLSLADAPIAGPPTVTGPTPRLQATSDRTVGPAPELPLFGKPIADDTPLITRASPPRTPLAVRRATPEVARPRSEARTPMLDLVGSDAKAQQPYPRSIERRNGERAPERQPAKPATPETAGALARMVAIVIDFAVLTAIDAAVLYFTMQIVGVRFDELSIVPKLPLAAFLIVQNIGYFVAFTAGGQTLGQMALGIKVVSDPTGGSPNLSSATLRTLVWVVLAAPAGLGLLTTLFSDGRGLHDRFARTRVVRASS